MASTLTFDDEFNSLSLWNGSTGTWDTTAPYVPLNGNGYSLPSNGEQEWYINSNYAPTSSVTPWIDSNGVLTLTAAPASSAISSLINGYQYTSGQINTSQSFSQTYGFFEMRAQLPAGQGLWPAFWLLPENGSWPPEIDAMEMLGNDPSTYYTSIHSGTASAEVNAGQADTVGNMSTGYHTFGVDWEASTITYYFDGQEVYQVATPSDMNTPMYMIANLAVGGAWPGNADSTTPFPANMNIDWIRAYSSLPSWIADGSDPTDVGHTPSSAIGGGGGGSGSGGGGSGSDTVPTADWQATYTVPSGVTSVVLTGTSAQTITANNLGDTITSNDYGSTLIGGTGNDTFIAGHGSDTMTGGGGSDTFVFNVEPWNAGHITDFNVATDKLDLTGIFSTIGYTGTDPVADGYLSFVSDGAGNTSVYVNPHSASQTWPSLITTLNGIAPASVTASDYIFTHATAPTGTTIESFGSTALVQQGDFFFLDPNGGGTGSEVTMSGAPIGAGQVGGWAAIGAEQVTGGGYEMAWHLANGNLYTVWNLNSAGNYVSDTLGAVASNNATLENLETSFQQDINGDGIIGPPPVVATTVEGNGSTALVQQGDYFFLNPLGGGTGPEVTMNGAPIGVDQVGGWVAIGAEVLTSGGYEMAWHLANGNLYTVWNLNSAGNYVSDTIGAVASNSATLENLETSFHQDLNGDGTIGPPVPSSTTIEAHGSTALVQQGDYFFLDPVGGGSGPEVKVNGAPIGADQVGGWATVGAEQVTGGYEMAWHLPNTNLYTVWSVDSAGNYLSDTMGAVAANSTTLEALEPSFHQDLNGDGTIGVPAVQTAAMAYAVASGVQSVVLTGTTAQTVTANDLGDTITSNDYGSTLIGGAGNDTFIAGHGADIMTGGGGNDTFVFNVLPWNASQITDFNVATDKLDLTGIFTTIGYTGSNPVADGYLSFASDGAGNTQVFVNTHSQSTSSPILVTMLDHIVPSSITAGDWMFHH